jgi:ABC-type hemin transport system ATPase subunit
MTKQVTETVTVKRMVPVEVEEEVEVVSTPDEDGNTTTTTQMVTRHTMEEQDVEQEVTKTVPDMSGAEEIDIFAFGYSKLKAKLDGLFGAENVIDC